MKKENAITLIALILTIIVLIILAGISINALNNNGIFERAKEARDKYRNAQNEEETQIAKYSNEINMYNTRNSTSKKDLLYSSGNSNISDTNATFTLNNTIDNYDFIQVICTMTDGRPLCKQYSSFFNPDVINLYDSETATSYNDYELEAIGVGNRSINFVILTDKRTVKITGHTDIGIHRVFGIKL